MFKKTKIVFFILFLASFFIFGRGTVLAAGLHLGSGSQINPQAPLLLERQGERGIKGQLGVVTGQSGYQYTAGSTPQSVVAQLVRYSLIFMGTVFVVVVLYGGFLWMTSGGNEERIGQAKKWLVNGAIGVFIVFASLSIWIFVIEKVYIASKEAVEEQPAEAEYPYNPLP